MAEEKKYCGNANIKTGQYGLYGNIKIELHQLCEVMGIDYKAFKKLLAKDFDPEKKQSKSVHLNAWTSKNGNSGVTLKLKVGELKEAKDYQNCWLALDDFIPGKKEVKAKEVLDDFPDFDSDELPY